jgi:hypothetical protein
LFKRNTTKGIILILLFVNAVTALIGGGQLMFKPDGIILSLPSSLLNGSVFSDYFIPGFCLFVFIGLFSLFLFFAIIKNKTDHSACIMLEGGMLLFWLAVQVSVIQTLHFFQLIYAVIGVLLLWLGFLNRNRKEE